MGACWYQEQDENVESNDECNEVIDIIDVESESGEIYEENVNDTSEINVNENINKTFHNPSQEDITPHGNSFKCEKCDFEAKTKPDLVNLKKETHSWCPFCFSSFNSQDNLTEHILTNHTE